MDGTPAPRKSSGTGQSRVTSHSPNPTLLPGQPVPQAYALTTARAEDSLPLAPSGYSSSSKTTPNFSGDPTTTVAAAKLVRNENLLNASNGELEQCMHLQGQQLQAALGMVFAKHEQVKITLPTILSEAHFLRDKALLSGLRIRYLELSGPYTATPGTNAQLFAFEERSTLVASALSSLNEIATEQKDSSIQLGLVLSTASTGGHTAMLGFAHARVRNALKLSDIWMDKVSARDLKTAVESLPRLLTLTLDVTAESPEVEQFLNSIKPRGTL